MEIGLAEIARVDADKALDRLDPRGKTRSSIIRFFSKFKNPLFLLTFVPLPLAYRRFLIAMPHGYEILTQIVKTWFLKK